MSVAVVTGIVATVTHVFGLLLGYKLANRWIDHRWYCGHRHPASHHCESTPENLERWRRWWRRFEEQIDRVEELEREIVRNLRRRS